MADSFSDQFCRRFTEIQSFTLTGCGLTDLSLDAIVSGLRQLRNLRRLFLARNLLGGESVRLLCLQYGGAVREPIESIDLRANSLTFEDGAAHRLLL